ncbi:HlyD family type I secretion periplasmic adaptor subunit [Plastoroseomonas arctica]|uniref:Membrane fusion protein (MFP) family protein n=1 Tax=Plastoroseomonas arctica TaxID=1509237 RepID=A0AAF1JVP1_9PROT|nr:HlyD family type I secretion periplasmic adaptor subunit [Plastoroseomonas arctica]MBR0653843.1 HlyD family type I secretion periplasmic adaptor subunit [Plastoroseomonas arctica]
MSASALTTAPAILARLRGTPRPRPRPIAPEAIGFQGELDDLLAEGPPPLLRGAHHLVALLFLLLLAVAAIVEVDVVVTGQGRLTPDAPPIVLQPMERAVIREIRVRAGDVVRGGQVLALLDTTFADADTATLTAQHRLLTAQATRIDAELGGSPMHATLEPDLLLQAALQSQREIVRTTRLRFFDEDIAGITASIRSLEESAFLRAQQADLARDVETMRSDLAERQVGSRLNLLAARSQRIQAEHDLAQARNRVAELRHALLAKQAERQSFVEDWRRLLMEDAIRIRAELARIEEQLGKARRLGDLTAMIAPQDGVVLEVARRSVGSVLREAEPLITLVPLNVPLIAEIALRSADIGHARPGDPVVVKIDAFPFQRHGALPGRLRAVAPESGQRTETGEARPGSAGLHAGQVELTAQALPGLPEGSRITPGMTLTAEIKVGTRNLLSYFLNPLTRGLQEAIREP